jgi:hypothetical protein
MADVTIATFSKVKYTIVEFLCYSFIIPERYTLGNASLLWLGTLFLQFVRKGIKCQKVQ